MKVQSSLRNLYLDQKPIIEKLKSSVDTAMKATKQPRWHYESRVKELESFCTKVETGRVSDPRGLEDFLACMLVVPNSLEIPTALDAVSALYDVQYRRPKADMVTNKAANAFPFDDLRLYCTRKNDGTLPETPLDKIVFEIQIKTFLQHAWGVATHDLSYKTDDVRWAKDRIVAHLKAAIEHAELSIQEASRLSQSPSLQFTHNKTVATADTIKILEKFWSREDLPANLRSLAETVQEILWASGIPNADLEAILQSEQNRLDGQMPLNLSPYGTIIELLLRHRRESVEKALRARKTRLLITPEIALPDAFPPRGCGGQLVRV